MVVNPRVKGSMIINLQDDKRRKSLLKSYLTGSHPVELL